MAVDTTEEIALEARKEINKQAEVNEAYFTGLMWSNPMLQYSEYGDITEGDEFVHDNWGFYFDLGKIMYDEGIKVFDKISVKRMIKKYNVEEEFKKYGGFKSIDNAIEIVGEHSDNIEHYYDQIKKFYSIRELYELFGDKVLVNKNKYKWREMNRDQLIRYWHDKMNIISLNSVNKNTVENLYIEGKEFIKKLKEESADMLPYYKSYMMNNITQGVPRGHVLMFGGFGGTGKSSITAEKFVMSLIENQEKGILILNEEDAQSFRQKLVLAILFHEHSTGIDRKRMVNGGLDEFDEEKILKAFETWDEIIGGKHAYIKVIFMEKYVMKDLEHIVRYWANRGHINLLIDTHKVSDDSEFDKRWETFVEDMKTIYRITRKDAGGLNLRTWVNFQLSDSCINNRFLDFTAIGEGKASKNEASIMFMFRPLWDDEYAGGDKQLKVYRLRKNKKGEGYTRDEFALHKEDSEGNERVYYLMFVPKTNIA